MSAFSWGVGFNLNSYLKFIHFDRNSFGDTEHFRFNLTLFYPSYSLLNHLIITISFRSQQQYQIHHYILYSLFTLDDENKNKIIQVFWIFNSRKPKINFLTVLQQLFYSSNIKTKHIHTHQMLLTWKNHKEYVEKKNRIQNLFIIFREKKNVILVIRGVLSF